MTAIARISQLMVMSSFLLLSVGAAASQNDSDSLSVVAAENFYGDIARQLAGPEARVTSILSNPDEDPHLFEASPSVARAVSAARILIYNGADYDPWMVKLLSAARSKDRQVVVVADLVHARSGDNPHLWYAPANVAAGRGSPFA